MQELIASFLNGSTKRVVAGLVGLGAIVLHQKLGFDLSDGQIAGITAITVAYIAQSGLNAAKQKGLDAAALVTPEAAKKQLDEVVANTDPKDLADVDPAVVHADITALVAKWTGKVVALFLCVGLMFHAMPAYAQTADAPKIEPAVTLIAGQPAPFAGTLRSPKNEQAVDAALVACDTTNKAVEKANIQWPVVVTFVVAAAATGALAAVGVCFASHGCK